jgi:hypothetical protein
MLGCSWNSFCGESCCTCSAKPEWEGSERYLQGSVLRLLRRCNFRQSMFELPFSHRASKAVFIFRVILKIFFEADVGVLDRVLDRSLTFPENMPFQHSLLVFVMVGWMSMSVSRMSASWWDRDKGRQVKCLIIRERRPDMT